jgi:uncharacterized protein YyaL (SSP411 family)
MPNRLASESSPYLLQHRNNPVDWYPWGAEAFERAKAEDKPVFLSIGYSTCHWCHVMERESFENTLVADALNRSFVSIKVDREERPDVDDVYMTAVQTMTGSGGWPLSLFLTPEARPFYGGTYYPPEDRWGRPGFRTLLDAISRAWTDKRDELESSAGELLAHVAAHAAGAPSGSGQPRPGPEALETAFADMERQFDRVHGGFGGAPKFPPAMRLELLLTRFERTKDPEARRMLDTTLTKMARGGMYDQVGGGFHRYSVDAEWLVPHFEKMLYDNAMLARIYLLAGRALGSAEHERIARETLDYLLREMTPPEGGFFAAQDADSGGEEGTFYVWTPDQLREVLGPESADLVAAHYGVTAAGNFEGRATVLSVVRTIGELAADRDRPAGEIEEAVRRARPLLYEAREKRVAPATDDKLLTDWSALAISAFALAGRLLGEPRYEQAAVQAANRILERCRRSDGEVGRVLLHRERLGVAGIDGFSTDYSYLVEALLDLYEATFEPRWFREAVSLQRELEERFADPRGGYALTAASGSTPEQGKSGDPAALPVRPRESLDGATPSASSVAASNLIRLHGFTGEARYRERAEAIFAAFSPYLTRATAAVPRMLAALDRALASPRQIVLSGEKGRPDFEALRAEVFRDPSPAAVVVHADAAESLADLCPLVVGRGSAAGPARAYVCEGFTCRLPTGEAAELAAQLHG